MRWISINSYTHSFTFYIGKLKTITFTRSRAIADCYIQIVQPATSTQSSDAYVSGQQTNIVDETHQLKPIKSVVIDESAPSEPPLSAATELPYRTRVNYKADDDNEPTSTASQAHADHVTAHSRSRGSPTRQVMTGSNQHVTSGQMINVTSPSMRDGATRIRVGDHLDKDRHR